MTDTMRSAQLVAPNEIEIREAPVPEPGPEEVLVRVRAVGVCGSDVSIFRGHFQAETELPYVLGHEFAGEVAAVGSAAEGVEEGARVACAPDLPCGECEWCRKGETNVCPNVQFAASHGVPGCLCDYFVVHQSQIHPIPGELDFASASLCEPAAIGLHVVENLAQPEGGESYAIMGGGPDGLTIMCAALENGASAVYVSDLVPERLEAARKLGADETWNAGDGDFLEFLMDRTDGRGVDVAIEAAGAVPAMQQVFRAACIHGKAIVLGIPPTDEVPVDMTAARRRELTMISARRTVGKYDRALRLIAEGKINADVIITHHFPFGRTQEAFEHVRDRKDGVLKAVVEL